MGTPCDINEGYARVGGPLTDLEKRERESDAERKLHPQRLVPKFGTKDTCGGTKPPDRHRSSIGYDVGSCM